MYASDEHVQNAMYAVSGAADGLSLAATRGLGAAALAAAGLPPEQQLAAVLHLAAVSPADGLKSTAANAGSVDQKQRHWVLAATAVEVLLRGRSPATADQVTAVLQRLLLPLLATSAEGAEALPTAAANKQWQGELLAAVVQLLADCGCWGLGLQLLRAAAVSSPSTPSSSGNATADAGIADQLPLHMRVRLAAAVVQRALEAASRQEGLGQPELDALLHHAATRTVEDVLALLASEAPPHRRQRGKNSAASASQLAAGATREAAAQLLLPAALQASVLQRGQASAMQQLWEACKRMMEGSLQQRQRGLALLVRFAAPLLSPSTTVSSSAAEPPQQQWCVTEEAAFWELLRACLCDSEAASRKRATYLLRLALQTQQPDGQLPPAWQLLLKLLECLEELTPHLVKDAWGEINRLHLPSATPQPSGSSGPGGSGEGSSLGGLEWNWMEVVWSRGLAHEHQHVQRLVLSSFLGRRWEPGQLAAVPRAFVLHTLLPAAGQAHMWRGEVPEQLQHDVAAWVGCYAAAAPLQEQRLLLLSLLGLLADDSRGSGAPVLQRPLAQTIVACVEAVASAYTAEVGVGAAAGSLDADWQWQLQLLGRLQEATRQLSSSWGAGGPTGSYAASVCSTLVRVGASAGPLSLHGASNSHAALAAAAAWLQQLPLPLLLPGGPLHLLAVNWLGTSGRQQLLPALTACAEKYMGQGDSSGTNGTGAAAGPAAASGQASWKQQSDGLARLAVLLSCSNAQAGSGPVLDSADLQTVFASWDTILGSLYRRPYLQLGAAERCLLLLNELLEAAQLLWAELPSYQHQHRPAVLDWLEAAISSHADELASYASMAAAPLWQQSQHTDAGQDQKHQQDPPSQLALACVCTSLQLLVQLNRGAPPAAPGERLLACCLYALQRGAEAVGVPAAAMQQQAPNMADGSAWQLAAAPLQPLASCGSALAAAAEAGWLSPAEPQFAAAAESAAEALRSVLLLQALAAEAAAASGASNQASGLAAYCNRLCWKAVHSLLLLVQRLHHHTSSLQQLQRQQWEEQQAAALAAALNSLQLSSQAQALAADYRGLLLQLRCCRMLLPTALQRQQVAQLALAQRQQAAAPGTIGQVSPTQSMALAAWVCSAAWQGYQAAATAAKRRRAGLTAAIVSTCLHPALFSNVDAIGSSPEAAAADEVLHGPAGPIQQLLGRLLELGAKSWRTMSIVSLQLCGLLSCHPELASHYSASLQALLLWGASDDPGQSGVGDPVDAEAAAELASLMAPGDAQLAAAFASSPLAPRIASLCLLHSWVQQAQHAQQAGAHDSAADQHQAAAAAESGRCMWHQLLSLALQDAELGATRYSPLGATHRKKVRLWQALCVLSPLVPGAEVEAVLDDLLSLMAATADAANVRQYQDSIALVLLRLRPDLLRSRVLQSLADCSSSGSHALSSLILIAARAAVEQPVPAGQVGAGSADQSTVVSAEKQQQRQLTEEQHMLLAEVVAAVAPWSLCHVHALRSFAQLVLWRLFELSPALPTRDATAAALLRFFRENDDINRLRRGLSHAFYFDAFQLEEAITPAGVLGQQGSAQRGEASFEGAPQPLLEAIQGFLAIERQALRHDMRQREAATAVAELAPGSQPQAQLLGGRSGGSNWQKKGGGAAVASPAAAGPWADSLGAAALLSAAGGGSGLDSIDIDLGAAEEAAAVARGGPRQELVVVASLLSKAPNLAGLTRTCEVFRASSLVLGDLAVTRQKEFISIAVTAHHWVPLQEVPEAALAPWLRRQAADGWTLVGLEQTAESVPLQDFEFPRRTVLVLGREKEGIPADILALLHRTVEIPQLGLIRSLNVHVSGAISMYEFTRQALQAVQGSTATLQADRG